MKIIKTSQEPQAVLQPGHLEDINRLSRTPLTEAEVYAFAVRLCDNQVDRDGERFPPETLEELAPLFVGKSGIFDHQWSAMGQTARIYRTEVVREENVLTRAGDRYCYLKGYAYLLRTEGNRELIAEMEENGIPTLDDPDVERDRRRAEHWETIGIGLSGYYQ